MRYWLLRGDANAGLWRPTFVGGVTPEAARAGVSIDAPPGPVRVTVSALAEGRRDFFELPCPVVSDAMRHALDWAGVDNVQYFPAHVEVEYHDEPVATDYWLANVVGAVACAAPLSSEAARDRGTRGVAPGPSPGFAVDPKRARDFDLFRLAEDRRLLVVSERVADALRAAGLQGVVLQAPEDYNGLSVSTAAPSRRDDVGA